MNLYWTGVRLPSPPLMKITFDHIKGFGKVKHSDFTYAEACGIVESTDNIDELLEQGWIPWFEKEWYNVRSVRINLNDYRPSSKTKKKFKKISYDLKKTKEIVDLTEIYRINDQYVERKEFDGRIDIDEIVKTTEYCFEFSYNDKIVAYTFMDVYEQSVLSCQFIYDYSCENLSVGNISQYCECLYAKELGKKYVYILSGYEDACLYKAEIYGMEWWTGKEWCTDYELYKKLCKRDTNIEILNYDNI